MNFPKIEAFPTCWENGMKLSADHFKHLEDSVEDAIRDARALGVTAMGSFGLLPYSTFSLRNAEGANPQSARITLEECRAIMPGGHRVEITSHGIQKYQLPATAPFKDFVPAYGVLYHIFLTVDEKQRIPAGKPETRPIRYPHLIPDYQLEIIAKDDLPDVTTLAPNRLKIGEWKNGKRIEAYIPATLTIRGFNELEYWYKHFETQLKNIIRVSSQVIESYRGKDLGKVNFCQPITLHLKQTEGYFRRIVPQQAPIHLLAYYEDLAGLVDGLMMTADRDFVRTRLQNGDLEGIKKAISRLTVRQSPPYEEIALRISLMKKFGESLLAVMKHLLETAKVKIRTGDERNLQSG